MRVRFFPVNASDRRSVIVDRLPLGGSRLFPNAVSDEECSIDEVRGTLVIRVAPRRERLLLNGCPIRRGPLLPGDRLTLSGTTFVVSYERMAGDVPEEPHFEIGRLDDAHR